MSDSIGVVHDGEGFAPVALASKQPVPQLVLDFLASQAPSFQPGNDGGDGVFFAQAVDV